MKLKNILTTNYRYLLVVALVLSSIAISIRSSNGSIQLVLKNYPFLIFFLIVLSSLLVAIYFQMNKRIISDLSDQIRAQAADQLEGFDGLLDELTERQREVYDLIISGKTY